MTDLPHNPDPSPAPVDPPRLEGRIRAAEGILRSQHAGGGARAAESALQRLQSGSTGRMAAVPAAPGEPLPHAPTAAGSAPRSGATVRLRPRTLAAAAGILVAAGLATLLALRPAADDLRVAEAAGDVRLDAGDGARPARPGSAVPPDTAVRLRGAAAFARLAFDDGTEVELRGEGSLTRLAVAESPGKGLRLSRGLLAATVRPQPAGSPFHVVTPSARIEALGTRLTVAAAGEAVRLDVEEGRARLTRAADRASVEVPGGSCAVSVPGLALAAAPGGGWWDSRWSRRRRIALTPPPRGAGTLANVPLLVLLTPERIDYAAAAPDGSDLRFVAADQRTVLPHEIEAWHPGGTSVAWVRLSALGPDAAIEPAWMYYGNAGATPPAATGSVWDDGFRLVYHLADVGGRRVRDASPRGRHGEKVSPANPCPVAGRLGGAQAFDGLGDFVDTGERGDLPRWTVEAWVRGTEAPKLGKAAGPVMRQNNYQLCWDHFQAESVAVASARFGEAWRIAPFGPMAGATWYYLAATYDGQTLRAYRDGALVSETPAAGAPDPSPEAALLGRHAQYPDAFFRGTLDEVRLSAVARPEAWIAAQHRSMTDALASFGPEEERQADGRARARTAPAAPKGRMTPAPGLGLRAEFFADRVMTDHRLARIDPAVDFFWESGIPHADVPELFAARWTGRVLPRATGTHVFTVLHDDGARLRVNGRLLFDAWKGNYVVVESRGEADLRAGEPADLLLELYNGGGRSVAQLLWTPPGGQPEIIPADRLSPP
jgi:biopolymer transport protein ExbB